MIAKTVPVFGVDAVMDGWMHSGNDEERLRNGFGATRGYASLRDLGASEISELTVVAVREHRRRLALAQSLYEKVESLSRNVPDELRSEYDRAVRDSDTQQMVVQMLVDILGYVPKIDRNG